MNNGTFKASKMMNQNIKEG